jgi:hypothetical protein
VFDDLEMCDRHFQLLFGFSFNMYLFTAILMHNKFIIVTAIIIAIGYNLTGPSPILHAFPLVSLYLSLTLIWVASAARRQTQVLENLL